MDEMKTGISTKAKVIGSLALGAATAIGGYLLSTRKKFTDMSEPDEEIDEVVDEDIVNEEH